MKAVCLTLAVALFAAAAAAQEAAPPPAGETMDDEAAEEAEGAPPEPAPAAVPSGTSAPLSSVALDPQTRLPPTSYNPSGAYVPGPPGPYVAPDWGYPSAEAAYESRLRSSFLSAQGLKGPLEGGWVLAASDGGDLYQLQLIDSPSGYVEGAWRDLRRPGALDASGLIVGAQRTGGLFNLRFYPEGRRDPVTATLTASADGGWSGELTENGRRHAVVLKRR